MYSKKNIFALFIILYTAVYYLFILLFDGSHLYLIIASDILQTIPPIIAFVLLLKTWRESEYADKYFWLHLSIGCGCYLFSQLAWDYNEIVLGIYNPALGWYSIFWAISVLSYIAAVTLKLNKKRDGSWNLVLIIDTLTVMCIALSFTSVYIILPRLAHVQEAVFENILYLAYPIGNLVCLYVSINLYFSLKHNDPERETLYLVSSAFLIMFFANSIYSYLAIIGAYHSGSVIDPLWSLYILILGLACLEHLTGSKESPSTESNSLAENYQNKSVSLLPISSVILLFVFMIFSQNKVVMIFSSISVVLITLRHAVIIMQNNQLISTLELVNSNLEAEVANRTQELYSMAFYDQLTNLPNRRFFETKLKAALLSASQKGSSLAVMFLDLDRFKTINDTLGHSFGDLILTEVAHRIESCLGNNYIISRQGGDEFAIIIDEFADQKTVENIAQKILDQLIKPMELNNYYTYTTCSIGISIYSQQSSDSETLMRHADAAMYRSKELGKNTYQFYNPDMDKSISRKLTLERELREAIECNEFTLYYQPQINTIDGSIIGAEALIRWLHPIQGLVFPADFIPIAEETGMIDIIGQWVLKTSLLQAKKWHDLGYNQLKIGVNISPYQLQQDDFVALVSQAIAETGLPPEYIDLEITESASIQNISDNIKKLFQLRDLGVRISVDDFGTGFSSLSYLNKLPINTLKIAQQFVGHLQGGASSKAIVSAIIAIAKNLKLNIIAEGVENVYQLKYLKAQGCFEMQGYLFGRPVPAEVFLELLKNDAASQVSIEKDV